jgi:hypothetical protein
MDILVESTKFSLNPLNRQGNIRKTKQSQAKELTDRFILLRNQRLFNSLYIDRPSSYFQY